MGLIVPEEVKFVLGSKFNIAKYVAQQSGKAELQAELQTVHVVNELL